MNATLSTRIVRCRNSSAASAKGFRLVTGAPGQHDGRNAADAVEETGLQPAQCGQLPR